MKLNSNLNIFIDTDMGNDDIMAICMLLSVPNITIKGISTVNGVSGVKKGTYNLLQILRFLNQMIPINQGYDTTEQDTTTSFPKRDIERAENLVLLNSLNLPIVNQPLTVSKKVEQFIFDSCVNKTILLALGPLTNIAKTIDMYGKKFKQRVSNIILMGGGIKKGNVPPFQKAEYNIWLDPLSAQKVFSSGIPITVIGIDATSKAPTTSAFKKLTNTITPTTLEGIIIQQIILNNDCDFDAFYDPLAAAILINSELISEEILTSIEVILKGRERGKTIIKNEKRNTIRWVMNIQSNQFYDLVLNLMKGGE